LVQKRGMRKDQSPGKLASSVGGHVAESQTIEEALKDEAKQELRIKSFAYRSIALFPYSSHLGNNQEIVTLFTGTYDGKVTPNLSELSWAAWFNFTGIARLAEQKPDLFAPSFLQDLKQFQKVN